MNGTLHGSAENDKLAEAIKELDQWKKRCEKADQEKSRLLLEKMDSELEKKQIQKETTDLIEAQERLKGKFSERMQGIQKENTDLEKTIQDLSRKLQKLQQELKAKQAETTSLQQRFKIRAVIPEKRVKFTEVVKNEEEYEEYQNIKGIFTITQRPSFVLRGGQALITFEEEKVADQILRLAKCSVACDTVKMDVKPRQIPLGPSVKFEVHLEVSKRTIKFSQAPLNQDEDRMRDRLEISFSKPSQGGGEVDRVDYDKKTGTGIITFLNTGVAENLSLKRKHCVNAGREVMVDVAPSYDFQLKKFQTFSGVPKRTVLLDGIRDELDEEDLQDHLEIHFQKPSNYGGEVETIKYISKKELTAFFSEDLSEMEA
ncbi:N-myc-interactor-like [Chanos chanos]|uniref:N-myc-interactor-like n=1 Tax=Chanos chanos TaxID=29144 RepID=A0A6J2WC18_CHACN|nr:N-myc-interactor-like [Chanos chanos]